jgi:hypothetical protein
MLKHWMKNGAAYFPFFLNFPICYFFFVSPCFSLLAFAATPQVHTSVKGALESRSGGRKAATKESRAPGVLSTPLIF